MAEETLYDNPNGKVYRKVGNMFVEVTPEQQTAADMSAGQAALTALGGAAVDIGRGAQMRAGQLTGDKALFYGAQQDAAAEGPARAALATEQPFGNTVGTVAPWLVAPVGGARLAGQVLTQGALGGLNTEADPTGGLLFGAGGGAAGALAGGAARTYGARGAGRGPGGLAAGVEDAGQAGRPGGVGSPADRVAAQIRAAAREANPAAPEIAPMNSLEDLAAAGRRQDVEDIHAVGAGVEPGSARAARNEALGYDPALLGGRAATRDNGSVHAWAVDTAKRLGFELTPGNEFNVPALKKIDAAFQSHPSFSAPFDVIDTNNRGRFNEIFNRAIGQEGRIVSRENQLAAEEGISTAFAKQNAAICERGGIPAGGLQAQIDEVADQAAEQGIKPDREILKSYTRENQTLDPGGLMEVRQNLGSTLMKEKERGRTTRLGFYGQMIEAIDEAVAAGARSQGGVTVMQREREISRLLRALDRPGVWKEEQNVMPGPLLRALKAGFRSEMRGSKAASTPAMQDLIDAVRMNEAVLKGTIRDSGTATRMSLQNFIANPVRTAGEVLLARGPAAIYMQGARNATTRGAAESAGRAWTTGGEQLSGIWGNTW